MTNQNLNIFLNLNPNKGMGIPIAVKDNFLTKGLTTTAGSFVLKDFVPQYSATVVKKLEDSGYWIYGKTNLDAWCHGSSTETSDFGPTLNPHDSKRLAGGSSGGSAAAVAEGIVDVAIGSETAGSVRGPASWCGVVGIKPTYGRVSRYGVIAMGSSLDSPGVLSKDIKSGAKVLKVIAGKDPYDGTTSDHEVPDYEKLLTGKIEGLKIGVVENYFLDEMDKEVTKTVMESVKVFEKLGAKIVKVKTIDPKYAIGVYTVVQRSEVSSNLGRYDGIRYGFSRQNFGEEAKRRIMLGTFTLSSGFQDKYYKKAQQIRTMYIEDFNNLFTEVDCLFGPTMPVVAPKVGVTKGQAMFGELADILAEPSSISGLPAISVPCGFVDGLPVGFQIIGKQFDEAKILNVGFAYEQNK